MFEFISDKSDRMMLESAYNVVSVLEMWNFLKTFEPGDNGFLFTKNESASEIMNKLCDDYPGHSGASLACTMRTMQFIAKNGIEELKKRNG